VNDTTFAGGNGREIGSKLVSFPALPQAQLFWEVVMKTGGS